MRRTRLVENREVFLAYVLANGNFSTLEGLHRRFPLVWQRRESYNYYHHVCFERPIFKEEYKLKFSYCLFAAAKEDVAVFNGLFEELYKQYKTLYKQLKKKYSRHHVLLESDLEQLLNLEKDDVQEYLLFLSIYDFFLEKLDVQMNECPLFKRLKQQSEALVRTFLGDDTHSDHETYKSLKQQLSKPSSRPFKKIKSFCRGYSEYLGQNLVDVLNQQLENLYQSKDSNRYSQWMLELGLIHQVDDDRLTLADVYQLVALVLCTREEKEYPEEVEVEMIQVGDFALPSSILKEFEQSLNELLPYFVMSRRMNANRECFLKSYTLNDTLITKPLEKEVERLKEQVMVLHTENQHLKERLSQQKLRQEKAHKGQLKELEADLILTLQANTQLEKELAQLKQDYLRLEEQLNSNLMPQETITEFQWSDAFDINQINCSEIMIVGGAPPTIQKLKRLLPKCKYFEVDKKYDDQYFQGITLAILLTNILNHGMTKRLDKQCPQIIKKSVTVTNVDLIMKEIAKAHLSETRLKER